MKMKMFSKRFCRNPRRHLEIEKEVNEWLAQMPNIKIHYLKQSMSGGSWAPSKIVISIFYE
jgi:hypothetical protein